MKKLNFLTKLLLLCIMIVGGTNGAWAQKTLFSQNFDTAGEVAYAANTAMSYSTSNTLTNLVGNGDNMFTSIACTAKNYTGIAINSSTGGGGADATGIFQAYYNNNGGYWGICRSRDFAETAPTAIKMTFDVFINNLASNNTMIVRFAIGEGITDPKTSSAPMNSYVHSGFAITNESSPKLSVYDDYATKIYNTALTNSTWYSLMWIINNTGSTLTYDNPTGSGTSTVNDDCFDLWLKTQAGAASTYARVVSGQAAKTATKNLQDMYIGGPIGKKHDFRMDNIVVYDLTPASEAYTVTFDAGSHGTCGTSSLEEASIGAGVTLPSVTTNTGYTFDGWYTSADVKAGDAGDTYYPSDNLTLYAHYTANTYTITLDDNGGTVDGSATATYGSNTLTSITEPTYSEHAVLGYYKEAELTILIADAEGKLKKNTDYTDASGNWTNTGAVTLYTKWQTLIPYTVTFDANTNGICGTSSLTESAGGAGVTLPTVTPNTHYVFNGWYDAASEGTKVGDAGETYYPTADITLYAQYTLQYTVTYNGNGNTGGSVPVDSDSPYTSDATVTVLGNSGSLVKSGYTFLGWNTESDRSGTNYTAGSTFDINDDVTLYAVWGENYCELKPATSGSVSYGNAVSMQSGSYGGVMTAVGSGLTHESNGLKFGNSADKPVITLNTLLKEGSVIIVTLKAGGNYARGLDVYSYDGKNKITTFSFPSDNNIDVNPGNAVKTFQYTVTSSDKLKDTNGFQLWRYSGNTWLQSLTVTDCQPGGVITASGWSTYSCNKKLDLSTISGGCKAYVATGTEDGKVVVKSCTDIVDAEEGLMIKGTVGAKFTIDATADAATFSGDNLLEGLPNGGTVSANDGNYVFGWPSSDATAYGFYYVNKGATLGIGKSYLHVDGGGSARLTIVFDEEETTGISASLNDKEQMTNDKVVYDLQGRKVAQPARGLYIVGGKKVIIK